MATVLGKRKKSSGTKEPTGEDAIQDIFRRHFEAQFKPLAPVAKKADKKAKKAKTTADAPSSSSKKLKNSATVIINENESDEESADQDDEDDDEEDDDESDTWSGLDGDDEDEDDNEVEDDIPAIEVVDYSVDPTKEAPEATMTKHERKLYLVSSLIFRSIPVCACTASY